MCSECLDKNAALWVTTRIFIKGAFRLTDSQLDRLPVLHSIPITYISKPNTDNPKRSYPLFSVAAAKRLAIEVHGSEAELARLSRANPPKNRHRRRIYKRYRQAPLNPPGPAVSQMMPQDEHFDFLGMASMAFPFVGAGGADYGRLCRGCTFLYDQTWPHWAMDQFPSRDVRGVVDDLRIRLMFMGLKLRPKDEFLEHIKECPGVPPVLAEDEGDDVTEDEDDESLESDMDS